MENLQKLMPQLQELLQEWYQFTLHNQEYAVSLAVVVWLLTAILYSIRIGFLKRDTGKIVKARQELQAQLETANAQLEAQRQELTQATEKMTAAEQTAQAEVKRAAEIESRLQKSNQQLAGSVANLVDCFELNQHQLPKADSDSLLPEYEAIIARVAERFENEQRAKTQLQLNFHAETAKLAEKEMLISSLQNRLDNQTQQLAKLELAVEQYEAAQRQLEVDKQQMAADMQKRQAEEARQHAFDKLAVHSQGVAVAPAAPQVKTEAAPELEKQEIKPDVAIKLAEPQAKVQLPEPEPVLEPAPARKLEPEAKSEKKESGKMKGLFGRAMDKIASMDQKLGTQTSSTSQPEIDASAPVHEEPVRVRPEVVVSDTDTEDTPVAEKIASAAEDMTAKLSGLFGGRKTKEKPSKPVEEPKAKAAEQVQQAEKEEKVPNKLSGLFGKLKGKK